eukprot:403351182
MQAVDHRQVSGIPLPKELQEREDLLLRVFRMTNRVKDQEEKHKALTTKNEELRTLYKNETQRDFKMQSTKTYLPKAFMDKSEDNLKLNEMRDKMRHAISAADINKLKQYVGEIENDADLKDLMKQEVNFSNQRIEIVTLQDSQRAAEQLLAAQQNQQ